MCVYLSIPVFNFTTDGPHQGSCFQLSSCQWGWMGIHRSFSCLIHLSTYGLMCQMFGSLESVTIIENYYLSVLPGDWTQGLFPLALESSPLSSPNTQFRKCEMVASARQVMLPHCASVFTFFHRDNNTTMILNGSQYFADSTYWL